MIRLIPIDEENVSHSLKNIIPQKTAKIRETYSKGAIKPASLILYA